MTKPFYHKHVFVCVNQREAGHPRSCCADKGAPELRDYMKDKVKQTALRRVRINQAGCLDRCELGPCMVIYPEGIWYRYENKSDIDAIISEHLENGRIVERLKLK